jgi:hypothetical protein
MLITFDSDVGSFAMDRDIAIHLLQAMGHSGTVPGAILPDDIPDALARLKGAIEHSPRLNRAQEFEMEDQGQKPPVSLRQRAFPLIDLLTRAAQKRKEVLWR